MPTPLRGPVGEARAQAQGIMKDAFCEAAIDAVKCRWPQTGPEDALPPIGFDRLLPQNPGESASAYRSRLEQAWALWPAAGTKAGILAALSILGFNNVQIFENADWTFPPSPGYEATAAVAITNATNANPLVITAPSHGLTVSRPVTITGVAGNTAANGTFNSINVIDANTFSIPVAGNAAYTSGGTVQPIPEWWRFWVVINPPHGFVAGWTVGSGRNVGDGSLVGFTSAPVTAPAIRPTVNLWKPSHAILESIIVLLSGSIVGGGWSVGDGTLVGGSTATI